MTPMARYRPRSWTAGKVTIMYGGAERMWTKEVQKLMAVSGHGYSAPILRQGATRYTAVRVDSFLWMSVS